MKFLRVVAVVAIVGFGSVNAEQSGWFVGGDLGYGELNIPFDYEYNNDYAKGKYNGGGAALAFVGGYKQFFTPYFGLRYFGNLNLTAGAVSPEYRKNNGLNISLKSNRSAVLVNFDANVDLLANFIVREKNQIADFGAFLGLGLGINGWGGQILDDIDNEHLKAFSNKSGILGVKASRIFFDISLNVGLRTVIYTNHGAELAFRMPLGVDNFVKREGFTVGAKNGYNVTLRYIYTFGEPRKVIKKVVKKRKRPSIEERLQQTDTQTTQKRREKSDLDMDEAVKELEKELGDI